MSVPDAQQADAEDRGRGSRLSFVVTRPVAITMLIVALAVFGGVSLSKLPVDLLPEISYPTLTVRTAYPGAAPEDVEERVSVRLQEALSTLEGLVRTSSVSRAGFSDVSLQFDWGTPMTLAVQEVRDRLDGVFLPREAERPLILRYDPNLDPILRIGVSPASEGAEWEDSLVRLRWLSEKRIKRELESVSGVAAVTVRGGLEEEIRVSVDPYKMAAQNLELSLVAQRLAQENLNASSGQIREGSTDYLVRTLNEFQDVEEISNLALVRRGEATVRIRDVARVERTYAEREVVTRLDGVEAVEVAIFREAGANVVEIAHRVREAVFGTAEQQLFADGVREGARGGAAPAGPAGPGGPAGAGGGGGIAWESRQKLDFLAWELRDDARMEVLSDQSTFIAAAINDVKQSALLGAALAVAVIWAFLRRLSATLIIAISIPISVIVTFAPMYLMGVSLNIMSLGGLALGVGMLVDNSIVVLESIARCRDEGDRLGPAAVRGTSEVSGAITASTLTTVAVFAPIVFVHGIAGQIFGDQAVTVVWSLLVSLLVAVLVIPMLASRPWLAGGGPRAAAAGPRPRWSLRSFLHEFFLRGLRWNWASFVPNLLILAMRSLAFVGFLLVRAVVLVGLALFAVGTWVTWPLRKAFDGTWSSLERAYPRALAVALAHPWLVLALTGALTAFAVTRVPQLGVELLPEVHQGEFTLHLALDVGTPIERSDEVFSEIDRGMRVLDGVAVTALTVGVEQDTLTREIEGEHTARLTVRLTPEASTLEREEALVERVRAQLASHPAVTSVEVTRPTPFALDAPVAIEVTGHDLDVLNATAEEVRARVAHIPGLTGLRTTVRPGHPEARVTFDRDKTLEYGLDLGTVSAHVRDQVLGTVSTRFVEGEDRIDIRVRGDQRVLATIEDVYDLVVNPSSDRPVPLRAVADIREVRGPAEIRRVGNSRATLVTAASTGLDLGGLSERIERSLADMVPPEDVSITLGGQKREMDEGMRSLRFALLLAIFLVYVVMATQFESLLQPFVILFSVPLAAVGVVLALDVLDVPLSVVVFIGLILLAGIVVNNAIVLVDRINSRLAAGLDVTSAVLEAGAARLRPILMTTATTVLGLLPLTGWLAPIPFVGALGSGEGAELRAPMAITVITGLTCSSLLTLFVIPVITRLVTRARPREATEPAPEVAPL